MKRAKKPRRIPANKGKKLAPQPLTNDEVVKLINVCSKRAPTGIRNRALIVVLYRAGLRISEGLAIRLRDLDEKQGSIRVMHGKGDKSRLVGLDAMAWAVLSRWIETRKELKLNRNAPLFCTLQGEPIEPAYIRALLPRLAKKAGIEKRVHAHGLRHTHAFELANEGTPLHIIQKQLGHLNLATTDRYVSHLNPQAVVDAMKARQWSL